MSLATEEKQVALSEATEEKKSAKIPFVFFPSIDTGKRSKRPFLGKNRLWYVQEKIDGSQTSFQVSKDRSKVRFFCGKAERHFDTEDDASLFKKMMVMVRTKRPVLNSNFVYHCETV